MNNLENVKLSGQPRLKARTRIFYGMTEGGLMLVQNTLALQIMFFMTDIVGISSVAAGLLFLFTRIWDAINDPMMGVIAEKLNLKSGKYRPYLLIGGIPLAFVLVMNFTTPGFTGVGKIVWCYVAYILFDMTYTTIFIPYTTMISSLSDYPEDWTALASTKAFFNFLFCLISSAATIPLVKYFGNGQVNAHGYQMMAITFAVIMVVVFITSYCNVKEKRDIQQAQSQKITWQVVKTIIFKNKPLLLVMIFYFLNYLRVFLTNSAAVYFFRYELGNIGLLTPYFIVVTAIMMTVCLLAPKLATVFGKMPYLIVSIVIGGFGCAAMYFFRGNFVHLLVASAFNCIGGGASVALLWSLVADVVKHTQKATEMKYDALLYSAVSFVNKLSASISGVVAGFVLAYFGYVANAQQTAGALFGIDLITFIIPCICVFGSAVPLLFFRLDKK